MEKYKVDILGTVKLGGTVSERQCMTVLIPPHAVISHKSVMSKWYCGEGAIQGSSNGALFSSNDNQTSAGGI